MEHYSNINNNLIPYLSNKYNLGNNKCYWKDLYVSNIYTNHNFKLELNQKDKLEKNGSISIISDSINKDAFQINIDKGGILFNSITNTIKTKEYFLTSNDIHIHSTNNTWVQAVNYFLETKNGIDFKTSGTRNSNIHLSSIYGKIKLNVGSSELDAIELSALKGGISIKNGNKGFSIESAGDITINSNRNIKIGTSNSLNDVFIGNTMGEVTIGNDLKVGGRILTQGEQRIEQLDSIRVETDEMLIELGKDNCNSLLDCGIIGNTGPDDKFGIYYHSMDSKFIFAEKIGENDNGIFNEPIKYGSLKASSLILDKITLSNGSLTLENKLNINSHFNIDNNGNLDTLGIINCRNSLYVKNDNGSGISIEPNKNSTKITGELWVNKLHFNSLYQYQIGQSLLWDTINERIKSLPPGEPHSISIWNNKIYKENIFINHTGLIIDGQCSTLQGSIIIDLNDSNIIHDTITIKNLNIESINNKLPQIVIKNKHKSKVVLENISIKNKHVNDNFCVIYIESNDLKLTIINSKIKAEIPDIVKHKLIFSTGNIRLKIIDSKLRNKPIYDNAISIEIIKPFTNNSSIDIQNTIIDGLIKIDASKLSIKDSEWNTTNEPHLEIENVDTVVLSNNKLINLSDTKSYQMWVEIPPHLSNIIFKFYGNRFLGLNEDYLLTIPNVKSYLIPQGSTYVNGIFANSYKQFIIKKNDIIIPSDHTFSELLIGNEMVHTNMEIMGKLENGKMMGQFKIIIITKCCANYYLQYNSNSIINIHPDSQHNINLVWNGKKWNKWN